MIFPHIPTILILGVVETLIDIAIFKLFERKHVVLIINIILMFIVPIGYLWLVANSSMPLGEQILVVADIFISYWFNFFNFILSGAIGLLVSSIIYMFTENRLESSQYI